MSVETPYLILAAGQSSRLGQPKGLYPYKSDRWLTYQLRRLQKAGISRVYMVLGYHAEMYRAWLAGRQQDSRIHLVAIDNQKAQFGKFSSLQTGILRILNDGYTSCFMSPVDVPAPGPTVFSAMLAAGREAQAVVPTYHSRGGHPVLLNAPFMGMVGNRKEESGRLDHMIRDLPEHMVKRVPTDDPCIVQNLNTPEDWQKWMAVGEDPSGLSTS